MKIRSAAREVFKPFIAEQLCPLPTDRLEKQADASASNCGLLVQELIWTEGYCSDATILNLRLQPERVGDQPRSVAARVASPISTGGPPARRAAISDRIG